MNRRSGGTDRVRGARGSVVLGWAFVLLALMSCCSLASAQPADAHHGGASLTAPRAITPVPAVAARVVVADAPGDRGAGSSCHGASEHTAPAVLPTQPAPAALPSAPALLPAGALTGACGIRGPSNDAAGDVDHLTLQVQRI
ncbi:hypothetical protein ACFVW8_28260 [Streptomyces sp. NPDC058221]|uniref:hypothetical protein n=1 Tax=Streptomyces sp. NPDC058221 TaxID=3346388 RepID=UPI0036E46114